MGEVFLQHSGKHLKYKYFSNIPENIQTKTNVNKFSGNLDCLDKMFFPTIFLLSLSITCPCLAWFPFGHENPQQKQQFLPEGVQSTDLRMPSVRIEKNDTYLCTAFPLDADEEHYIGWNKNYF